MPGLIPVLLGARFRDQVTATAQRAARAPGAARAAAGLAPGRRHRPPWRWRPRLRRFPAPVIAASAAAAVAVALVAVIVPRALHHGSAPGATAPRPAGVAAGPPLVIAHDTTLRSDVHCSDLTIEPGVTLTTDGHDIYCTGTVDNEGTIVTGPSPSRDFPLSYGGSGGGSTDLAGPAAAGFSTRSSGGAPCGTSGCTAADGASPALPGLNAAVINAWYRTGMNQYLAGAGGGSSPAASGGPGANGLFIEAVRIVAGQISAAGSDGQNQPGQSTAGRGGGAVIVLAYVTSLTPGSYEVSGGYTVTADGTRHEFGGTGAVIARQFRAVPVTNGR